MQQTKIGLSPKELEMVTDAGLILTKNAIIAKVYALFGVLNEEYSILLNKYPVLAEDIGPRSPKISKGEQYEELPWVMLDHPRNYQGEDAFGIRSFFWWGNYCSITLQLSGSYQQKYAPVLQQNLAGSNDWFIGVGTDRWQHHFRADNYQPFTAWKGELATLPFIKLAKKIPLQEWDKLDQFFVAGYASLLRALIA
jgi:hypothetical protein